MANEASNIKIRIALSCLAFFLVAGFGAYFLRKEINKAGFLYEEKKNDLVLITAKQDLASQLKEEFIRTEEDRENIVNSMLLRSDILKFIQILENTARKENLVYKINILREITWEDIAKQREASARARKKELSRENAEINDLARIVFNIEIKGGYGEIIRFFEGIGTLPYYTKVESFDIRKKITAGQAEREEELTNTIQSRIELSVFIRGQ